MSCPDCGASRDEFRADDYWKLHHPPGMARSTDERHPKDEHVWYITCESCDTMIGSEVEADTRDEAIDKLMSCDHPERDNELEMACRPSDHLDTYIAYPVCPDCSRIWAGTWADVTRDGEPKIA